MPVLNDFHQVQALHVVEFVDSEVINDQELSLCDRLDQFAVVTFYFGYPQAVEQLLCIVVLNLEAICKYPVFRTDYKLEFKDGCLLLDIQ